MMGQSRLLIGLAFGVLATFEHGTLRADDAFFETRVRPVLADHCFECHAGAKAARGLRLDRPDGFRTDDGQGMVVVPGDPAESRLIRAIEHHASVAAMPPTGRLQDEQIVDLRHWVAQGAQWPVDASIPGMQGSNAKGHWSFQPLRRVPAPASPDENWNRNPVDRWVDARRRAAGLSPSPRATPNELARRLAYDLTGLPPDPSIVERLVDSEGADEVFAEIVSELLDSDAFGQHWGRHWLDVARYSELMGMNVEDDAQDTNPFAYTYRDWVVDAFRNDLPYNTFIEMQLAADHLRPEHHPDLAALGFLTIGNKFEGDEPNQIDDRLDAIFRGLQGLAMSCARCHDHKYDPISTHDYYSLYAIFSEGTEQETPILQSDADREALAIFRKRLRDATHAFEGYKRSLRSERFGQPYTRMADYLLAASEPESDDPVAEDRGWRPDGLHQSIVVKIRQSMNEFQSDHHPVFAPWIMLRDIDATEFETELRIFAEAYRRQLQSEDGIEEPASAQDAIETLEISDAAANVEPVNARIARALIERMPSNRRQLAEIYGEILADVAFEWLQRVEQARADDTDLPDALPNDADDEIRQQLFAEYPALDIPDEDLMNLLEEEAREQYDRMVETLVSIKAAPDVPPHARVFIDGDPEREQTVFIRGKQDRLGDRVSPRFVGVLAPDLEPYAASSGRLELARSIVDPYNPLTARVWVNRVWQHLIGRGIVDTPSDFGARGSVPSHPELLDALTLEFIKQGWSTKELIRKLVATETYRQSSRDRAEAHDVDPENRWLWRMNRKRLTRESLRDSILFVSEQLDASLGGHSISPEELESNPRRTLYFSVHRRQLDPMSLTFDLPSPSLHSPRRDETIVPQQALYMLNNPLVIESSRTIAESLWDEQDEDGSIAALVQKILHRDATLEEFDIARRFLAEASRDETRTEESSEESTEADDPDGNQQQSKQTAPLPGPARFAQLLLMSNEFLYVD